MKNSNKKLSNKDLASIAVDRMTPDEMRAFMQNYFSRLVSQTVAGLNRVMAYEFRVAIEKQVRKELKSGVFDKQVKAATLKLLNAEFKSILSRGQE